MSYARVSGHRTMVFDQVRNQAFLRALQACITPDSVVLDLGAGTGILGLLAARAGARRVYLVEKEPVIRIARELARQNGLQDRIVILEGCIEELQLPEPVDVILSVLTGNLLYSEDLLPALYHARERYLKRGGILLPDLAELWLAPASAAALHQQHAERWSEPQFGLDFSAARQHAINDIVWLTRGQWQGKVLGAALHTALDLRSAGSADCSGSCSVQAEESGDCHGLLAWIRLRLGDTWISTAPDSPELHWSNAFLPFDVPLPLAAGEEARMSLQRPLGGDWSWGLQAGAGMRRQSEFLARLDGPEALRRLAESHRPQLDARGRAAAAALALMDGGHSNALIAAQLQQQWPLLFADTGTALDFVRKLVRSQAWHSPS